MIEILVTLFFLIILVEIFIFLQKRSTKNYFVDISRLNLRLETIRSLSYLLAKKKDLKVFAKEASDIFLSEKTYTSVKLVDINNENYSILFDSSSGEESVLNSQISDYLKTLRSNEITFNFGIIFVPLYFQSDKIGYILLTGDNSLNDEEKNFLEILAGTLTLIVRGVNFNKKISYTDQLRAVSKKW